MENETTSTDQTNQDQQTNENVSAEETPKRKRQGRSFGDRMIEADLMTAGIKNHIETVTLVGLNEDYLANFKAFIESIKDNNELQERIKAQQKEKTAELKRQLKELTKKMRHARENVKSVIPQELWKEFGITTTR
ncbi:MAG: hypothetical protein GY940_11580 [bacterium]|nr:hypothetical protein [bacterium]